MVRNNFKLHAVFAVLTFFWFFLLTYAYGNNRYDSLSHRLMQSICLSKVVAGEKGLPECTCNDVSVLGSNSSETFAFEEVFYGNFTGDSNKELFAVTTGCEPHADSWGGAILFEKEGSHRKVLFYSAGYPGKCKIFQSSKGKNDLLCLGEYMNQGYGEDRLVHYKVTKSGLAQVEVLYSGENDEGAIDSKQIDTMVKRWYLKDIKKDGYLDVVVIANQSGKKEKKITYIYRDGSFKKRLNPKAVNTNMCKSKTFIDLLGTAEMQTQKSHYKKALEVLKRAYHICPMKDLEEMMAWLMGEIEDIENKGNGRPENVFK